MKSAPIFTVKPCSISGHSLLTWQAGSSGKPGDERSLQMETEIAHYLAECANMETRRVPSSRGMEAYIWVNDYTAKHGVTRQEAQLAFEALPIEERMRFKREI